MTDSLNTPAEPFRVVYVSAPIGATAEQREDAEKFSDAFHRKLFSLADPKERPR